MAKVTPIQETRQSLIDEFGLVEAKRREFAPTERRYQQLREKLAAPYSSKPADVEYSEKGSAFELRVSARENQRKVRIAELYKRLGIRKFLAVCAVTLKALESVLTKVEIDAFVVEERTGSRTFTTTPIYDLPAPHQIPPEKKPA